MVVRTVLLMLLAIPASFGSLYCEFNYYFCDWKSVTWCDLKLIANQPLDGDTGYLLADAKSCQPSQISQDLLNEEGPFKFRLKYLLRGPDPARLSVEAQYTMSNNQVLWSTNKTNNPGWSYNDIVAHRGTIDVLDSIAIMAYVSGSSTVAIGSISKIEPSVATTECKDVNGRSTITFTTTDSNLVNKPKRPRISLYIIGAAFALIILIILSVSVFCFVRN